MSSERLPTRIGTSGIPERWRPSIRLVLVAGFGTLTLAAAAIVLLIGLAAAQRNTDELVQTSAQLVMELIRQRVGSQLGPAATTVEEIAAALGNGDIDPADRAGLERYFVGAVSGQQQIGGIGYIDENLEVVAAGRLAAGLAAGSGSGREWATGRLALRMAKRDPRLTWQGVSYIPELGGSFLIVHAGVERAGVTTGVVFAAISVAQLSADLERFAKMGTRFILRGDDQVLAHPFLATGEDHALTDSQPLPLVGQTKDIVLRQFLAEPPEVLGPPLAGEGIDAYRVAGLDGDYILLISTLTGFDSAPWRMGVYFSADETRDLRDRMIWALGAGIAIALIALALALWLGRGLARPIQRLGEAADRVAALDFAASAPLPRSVFREIDRATLAFNALSRGLSWFETYVPRVLVGRLVSLGDAQAIQPEERELSVMFTDIVGFSSIAHRLPPDRLAAFLNRHFGLLASAIEVRSGTIDKYIGDSVMAFWGAPSPDKDHAHHAAEAALAIVAELKADNARRQRKGIAPVRIRIGLHLGRALAGNIGAPGRVNYTLVGDAVNMAQRLEQLGKAVDDGRGDVVVLASADFVAALPPEIPRQALGAHELKGFAIPVQVYRIG